MGIGYRYFYRKIKDWLWYSYLSKFMPARADFYIKSMPDLEIEGWGLDIGCGDCSVTSQIANKYELEMIGIDTANYDSHGSSFLLADASRLPFKDGLFSIVTCVSLIEHVRQERRIQLYRETYRILRKEGYLVMQLPNRFFPIEPHSYLPFIGYLPSPLHGFFYPDYCRIPSKNKLLADLHNSGFELIRLDALEATYLPFSKFLHKIKIFRLFPFGYLITMKKPPTSQIPRL